MVVVSYPDPDSQQLRVDYITATYTWKVGLEKCLAKVVPSARDFTRPIRICSAT